MDKQLQLILKVCFLAITCYVVYLLSPLLSPVISVVLWIVTPLLIGLYAFYMFRPIKIFLEQKTNNSTFAFIVTFLSLIVLIGVLGWVITDIVVVQLASLANSMDPETLKIPFEEELSAFVDIQGILDNIKTEIPQSLSSISSSLNSLLKSGATFLTQILLFLLTVFYLLRDEALLKKFFYQMTQGKNEVIYRKMVRDMHQTLKDYISGRMVTSIILGALMLLFYVVFKVPNPFLLAVISLVTNLILYIGPFLGAIPALFIGATVSSKMVIQIAIATIVIQQIESSIISPKIMGDKLDIHPFVVMLTVLIGLNLFGIVGALFATPIFLMIKIVFNGYKELRRQHRLNDNSQIETKL
ncbi:AI-2E family transporter [Streptococcus moroccensis]|uniref:PurR-regulated permease PerM n=1 Tax=Streptococcus moroccensis TaxID=1451356 RepID=A0ABT9YRD5_9STRE|nr:AI-2E family transporter [Streptococcus moroccensis]MDQ0221675.1 putative PurR-regulated permease PerM [Streptococcus moroccensis]